MRANSWRESIDWIRTHRRWLAVGLLLMLTTVAVFPQTLPLPKVSLGMDQAKSPDQVSESLKILALLTVLSLAPAILILTTAFTRIVIILSLLRTAIGAQNIPPNQVVVGISLFLTLFVMSPTYTEINEKALQPYFAKKLSMEKAIDRAQAPLRKFMLKNTYSKDLKLFVDLRGEQTTAENVSMLCLIPAFVVSELKTAFIVGFYVFVPFIIIDLIVASILMSLGMMMMPPTVISLPAKMLVFILADGWSVIAHAIVTGYR